MVNALLKAAINWKCADDVQQSILDALLEDDYDYAEYRRRKAEHERVIAELVLPAKRALHLAIERAVIEEEEK